MSTNITISQDLLPNSLRLPPHLSAHKYFFVCTLTVAAWDSLVLSPRSFKLLKTEGWPVLKAIFFFLRILMPAEFIVVGMSQLSCSMSQQVDPLVCIGVAFFDSAWSRSVSSCSPGHDVHSILFRLVNDSSCSSPSVLLFSWVLVRVCGSLDQPLLGSITAFTPVVHAIRIHGIYDKNRSVLYGMSALLALQVVVTAICCGFYRCECYILHHL